MTMTELRSDERFEFDMADRLRRALRVSRVGVQEMADHLDVDRTTISNWINGRSRPRRRDLRLFAMRTGYPLEWLETGKAPAQQSEGQELPDLDSNQEPAGLRSAWPRRCPAEVVQLRPVATPSVPPAPRAA